MRGGGEGPDALPLLVARRGDAVFAYVNSCPHAGTPLDWQPDRFMTRDGRYLLCATHGATFEVEDGRCVAGPPYRQRLRAVPAAVEGGMVVVRPSGP